MHYHAYQCGILFVLLKLSVFFQHYLGVNLVALEKRHDSVVMATPNDCVKTNEWDVVSILCHRGSCARIIECYRSSSAHHMVLYIF